MPVASCHWMFPRAPAYPNAILLPPLPYRRAAGLRAVWHPSGAPGLALQSCFPASLSPARSGSTAHFQPISLPTLHHFSARWLCRSHGNQQPLPSLHPLSWSCHHRLLSGWSGIVSLSQICLISLVAVVRFEILLPDKPEKLGRGG